MRSPTADTLPIRSDIADRDPGPARGERRSSRSLPPGLCSGRALNVRMRSVGDSHGTTLSIHADGKGVRTGPRPEPVLVLVLECGRPRSGSVRYRLSELTMVNLGRG